MTDHELVHQSEGSELASGDSQELQLVTFCCGEEEFAVDILSVQEINRMMEITQLPQSSHDMMGVINLRGVVIPIVDLRDRFGMATKELTSASRIIVVDVEGKTIGFVVDEVREVLRVKSSCFEDAPRMCASVESSYIKGVGKLEDRLVILLDITRVLSEDSHQALETVASV